MHNTTMTSMGPSCDVWNTALPGIPSGCPLPPPEVTLSLQMFLPWAFFSTSLKFPFQNGDLRSESSLFPRTPEAPVPAAFVGPRGHLDTRDTAGGPARASGRILVLVNTPQTWVSRVTSLLGAEAPSSRHWGHGGPPREGCQEDSSLAL